MDERFLVTASVALALGGVFGSGSSRIGEMQTSGPITPVKAAVDTATLPSRFAPSIQGPEDHALEAMHVHVANQVRAPNQANAAKQAQGARHGNAANQRPSGKQWAHVTQGPAIWQEADATDQAFLVPSVSETLDSEGVP
jgi:hypothetical protein